MTIELCPAQQPVVDGLLADLPLGGVFIVTADTGMGKTTVLRAVHRAAGGAFLTMKEFIDALRPQHPLALEEAFEQWLLQALSAQDVVIVDDAHMPCDVTGGCGAYPRPGLMNAPAEALAAYVDAAGKKLILGSNGHLPDGFRQRSFDYAVAEFQPHDYHAVCRGYLDAATADRLDFAKIHRFAPNLNAHQLKAAAVRLRGDAQLDTDRFIDFLRARQLTSNVDLKEVRPVTLRDLKGIDEVIASLETNIVLPLENDELAERYQLKPKRGVLLAGPPGTGKTTVGRALAHRLRGKFFLIDGTFISGTDHFYHQVHWVFRSAKENAPAVLFIDDSDVIFEGGQELGLYRYLLTMLDGLESASAGRVCVMLTAMDVSHLPPALLRSGRIELWLELRLPDETARGDILRDCLAPLPPEVRESADVPQLAALTAGYTGADLRRLVDDGKNLFAHDLVQGKSPRPLAEYLLSAAATLRANKDRYAAAEARTRRQRPSRPVYYDPTLAGSVAPD